MSSNDKPVFTEAERAEQLEYMRRIERATIRTDNSVQEDHRCRIEMLEIQVEDMKKAIDSLFKMIDALSGRADAHAEMIDVITPKHLREDTH